MNTGLKFKEYNEEKQLLIKSQIRTFTDNDTGEVFEAEQIIKRFYGQKQFWKVYLSDFLEILGILQSKQVDILVYIIENTDSSTNLFLGTYKKIAKNTNTSEPTIATVMKKLQDNKFIKKIQNGAWQVSPHIMMKGSEFKKSLLINYYNEE
uniref:Plasmid replication protein RepL domain-containing protein n=1 Tax=uncultured prokaryote TaxID=198431 RepID=A0A0H5Q8Q0_9ZZZZ|nr:hypothetical protein [uncultured prokaryote]